jgi:hypothetical protein
MLARVGHQVGPGAAGRPRRTTWICGENACTLRSHGIQAATSAQRWLLGKMTFPAVRVALEESPETKFSACGWMTSASNRFPSSVQLLSLGNINGYARKGPDL